MIPGLGSPTMSADIGFRLGSTESMLSAHLGSMNGLDMYVLASDRVAPY